MNRLTLWTRKYNLPTTLSWAMAIIGLAALLFMLLIIPAYLELVIGLNGQSFPIPPLWRWLIIVAYVLIMAAMLFSPILVTKSIPKDKSEEQKLRRQSLISTMAAGTIQEIRSPLTAARGFVQLINALSQDDERTKEYSEYALLEMDRIEQLLQEYMLLSKAVAPKSQPVNLLDVAHATYQMMEAVMAERNIRLRFEGSQPSCILGDPFYLQQVLQHLLLNAADATPPKGVVSIKLFSSDKEVTLIISDTGVGMSQEALEHCFDPFYSTKESGTGLGLAICQRMVTDMRGRIEVDSHPQSVTTFTITFPLYQEIASKEELPQE
ncbi:MAG: HAMP domain-containing histidine kinase [Firmicutes bacterium]|nr:HAMP domain-containing histidine kinase [Bacillota bacterium]